MQSVYKGVKINTILNLTMTIHTGEACKMQQ